MNDLDPNLLNFVTSQLKAGVNPEVIQTQLTKSNWKTEDIDQAFQAVQSDRQLQSSIVVQSQIGVVGLPGALVQSNKIRLQLPAANSSVDTTLAWIFRAGFAGIFLINGITAWVRPEAFQGLLTSFPITRIIGHTDIMLVLVGFNDLILGGLILSGKAKKFIWAWAGVWLTLVTLIKLVSLL